MTLNSFDNHCSVVGTAHPTELDGEQPETIGMNGDETESKQVVALFVVGDRIGYKPGVLVDARGCHFP
ncbi:hypothetical protein [[Phormidium] sp. ETS-05]|uniref:hypothetical protein n=1 Tax=[Phormidium] sp. ETS-05 TaxID=222819 RepID=UPI001E6466B7|nr:hypothetical protein [[Phormidium] sp. ETS-05]